MVRRRLALGMAVVLSVWSLAALPAAAQAGPAISSPHPPNGAVAGTYLHDFTTTGFTSTPAYAVTSGSVPPGVIIDAQGHMFGVPTAAGTYGPTTVCASNGAQQACQTFTVVIAKLTPILFSQPSAGGPVGTAVRNTTTVGSQQAPGGTITFRLYSDAACTNQVFTSTKPVDAQARATSDDFVPTVPGTYRWSVFYSGDANHEPSSFECSATNTVTITGGGTTTTSSTLPTTTTTTSTTSTTSTSTTSTTAPPTSTTSTSTSSTVAPTPTTTSTSTSTSSTSSTSTSTTSSTVPTGTTSSSSSSTTSSTSTSTSTSTSSTSTTSTTVVSPSSTSSSSSTSTSSTSSTSTTSTTSAPPVQGTSTTATTLAPTATTLAPTATTLAPTATTLAATTTPTTPAGPTITTDRLEADPGDPVTIAGSGFPPGAPLAAELRSDPVQLGTTVADASGRFRITVTVPLGTAPGLHTLRVRVVGGIEFADASLLVRAPAAVVQAATRGQVLSRTGGDDARRAGWAMALVATGFVLVGLAWNDRRPPGRRSPWASRKRWL